MVRISYIRKENGDKQSKPLLLDNELVTVNIDLGNRQFTVNSVNDGRILAEGKGSSESVLTMNAKKLLRNLGVNFEGEIRRREVSVVQMDDNHTST